MTHYISIVGQHLRGANCPRLIVALTTLPNSIWISHLLIHWPFCDQANASLRRTVGAMVCAHIGFRSMIAVWSISSHQLRPPNCGKWSSAGLDWHQGHHWSTM